MPPEPDDTDWDNANLAIFGRTTPDLQPLADLLLDLDRPIPRGTRHMLASMLSPDGHLHHKLELRRLDNMRQGTAHDLKALEVTVAYRGRRAEGKTAEVAAEETGEEFGIDPRTVYRYEKQWDELSRSLRGR